MGDKPDFVMRYMEVTNARARMKEQYKAQDSKLKEFEQQLEPQVGEWLKAQPRQEERFSFEDPKSLQRFGKPGKLVYKEIDEPKQLSYNRLDLVNRDFYANVFEQQFPHIQLSDEDKKRLAALHTDYTWAKRETKRRTEVRRTVTTKRRRRK